VRGGGRKPWKQKGTGRARHGSRRSPIWTGGGVTFGPRKEKDFSKKLNKNVRSKALASVLSKKQSDGEVIFVDSLSLSEPKTAEAKLAFAAIAKGAKHEDMATKRKNAALIVLSERDLNTEKSFRNFGNVEIAQVKDINPVDLLTYKYVLVAEPAKALETLEKRVSTKTARITTTDKK
jgi:large subunit ribosomal protein L4